MSTIGKPRDTDVVLVDGFDGVAVIPRDAELTRLHYFDGRLLRAEHLEREQRYLRHLAWFGNRLGGSGVLEGFEVEVDGDTLRLAGGAAVDAGGRPLLLPGDVELSFGEVVARSRRSGPIVRPAASVGPLGPARGGLRSPLERGVRLEMLTAKPAAFDDCVLLDADPGGAVTTAGVVYYVISIAAAEGLCGEEDVFGRLCEDACERPGDRAFGVEGVLVRATPVALALRSSRFAATQAHLRSLFASAWFAREDGIPGSLISGDGLASPVWCLGAGGEPLPPDVPGVPLALVGRAGSATVFQDAWTVRRERMEAPPRRYWDGRLAMRAWPAFLAQVLQFQCQLSDLGRRPTAGTLRSDDPCSPHATVLAEATKVLAEVRQAYPAALDRVEELRPIAGLTTRITDVLDRIRTIRPVLPLLARERVLLAGGIVELPPAGYLPVAPGPQEPVNRQVRRLLGEGVDVRFCVAAPDVLPHEFEQGQHMQRISLLDGLENPARKPEVDVFVPNGSIERVEAPPPGLGFEGRLLLAPTVFAPPRQKPDLATGPREQAFVEVAKEALSEPAMRVYSKAAGAIDVESTRLASTASVHGAGRGERTGSGGAFHFAGATEVQRNLKIGELVQGIARLGKRGAVASFTGAVPPAKEAGVEPLELEPQLAYRVLSLATDARRVNVEAKAEAVEASAFRPPLAAGERALVAVWATGEIDADPFGLPVGGAAALRGRLVLAFPAARSSWVDVTLRGELTVLRQPFVRPQLERFVPRSELGRRLTARFRGAGTWASSTAGDPVERRTDELDLLVTIVEPFRADGEPASLELHLSGEDGTPVVVDLSWGGDPLHVEAELRREPADGDPQQLAAAQLVANPGVLAAGDPVHSLALSALEIAGATLGDADLPAQAAARLFPPPPAEPLEPDVVASLDWVLFRRRRRVQCSDRAEAIAAVPRSYRVHHLRVEDEVALRDVRLALLRNDRERLAGLAFADVTDVEFGAGAPDLASAADAVLADWRAQRPGTVLLLASIATYGGADGEQLALARLGRLEQALAPVSATTSATVADSLPYVPELPAPGRDGTIVLVTGRLETTTCHDVYRVDPARSKEARIRLEQGDLDGVVGGESPLAVRIGEADFAGDAAQPVPGSIPADAWNEAGGGAVAGVAVFGDRNDEQANDEELLVARANAIAAGLAEVEADPGETVALLLDRTPGECPAATFLLPALAEICHDVRTLVTENPGEVVLKLRDTPLLVRLLSADERFDRHGTVRFARGTTDVTGGSLAAIGGAGGELLVRKTVNVYVRGAVPADEPLEGQAELIAAQLQIGDPHEVRVIPVGDPTQWPADAACPYVTVAIVTWSMPQ